MLTSRRQVTLSILASAAASPLLAHGATGQRVAESLALTASCADNDDEVTPAQNEGPYFSPNSPFRQDFTEDGTGGDRLVIGGSVLDAACQPVPKAMIELWHADADGTYDNEGYRYRGHTLSDDQGRWWFSTIVPGLYPGRTRHYHLKVQRPGGETLTTQLYFPDEEQNKQDRIFNPRLLLRIEEVEGETYGLFNFVVA